MGYAQQPSGDQKTAPSKSDTASKPAKSTITRADLAAAYLRLEQAFFASPPPAEEIARINKAFDQATQAFFLGNNAGAIRAIDSLTQSLSHDTSSPLESALVSLKATVEPPVWQAENPTPAVCRVTSLYDWPSDEPISAELRLRLIGPKGNVVVERPLAVNLGKDRVVDVETPLEFGDRLEAGVYHVVLATPEGGALVVGRAQAIDGPSLGQQRLRNEERLDKIAASEAISQPLAICRARNQLLVDRPSEENSAQFLADLNALAAEVAAEIAMLESGKNPYARRQGDYWRVLATSRRDIPLRLYAPKLAAPDEPAPLLVVLHGMGGDENMFFEAYGAGVVKKLADAKGLIVASPLTYTFGSDIKNLQSLVDSLSNDYAIDRRRVYVLGHSMGAGAAAGLARGQADTIAAACCIAGGRLQAAADSPPILVVSPELDGVVPAKGVQDAAQKAISAGMPAEIIAMPEYGHTLAVGAILPQAINWLLGHQQGPTP